MSVDTHARLDGHIVPEAIVEVLQKLYGDYGSIQIAYRKMDDWEEIPQIKERYDNSGRWRNDSCFINFHTPDHELRQMFYMYLNVNFHENLEYYTHFGLEDMVKTETTFLSLGKWGMSIEVLKAVVEHFGGWLDEDDCDDIPFYRINKETSNG